MSKTSVQALTAAQRVLRGLTFKDTQVTNTLEMIHRALGTTQDEPALVDPGIVRVRYKEACKKAEDRSRMYACTVHVNAQVGLLDGNPVIHHFSVSDWYDGSTLATYTDGTLVMSHTL